MAAGKGPAPAAAPGAGAGGGGDENAGGNGQAPGVSTGRGACEEGRGFGSLGGRAVCRFLNGGGGAEQLGLPRRGAACMEKSIAVAVLYCFQTAPLRALLPAGQRAGGGRGAGGRHGAVGAVPPHPDRAHAASGAP